MNESERCAIAHKIAEEICKKSDSYGEALRIVKKIEDMVKLSMNMEKAKVLPYVTDSYGQKIEVPETKASDTMEKIKN